MILLVGASASGKTALSAFLRKEYHFTKTVTYTTRKPRMNEVNGVDYHFVSNEVFKDMEKNAEFVETTFYNGNFYGSAKSDISDNKVLIVDPSGLLAYKSLKNPSIVSFYLEANEETRIARMKERSDTNVCIRARLENDKNVFTAAIKKECNYIVETDAKTLEEIAKEVLKKYKDIIRLKK
ncbi:MAG TPA: hypothetical protein DCZ41_05155 [Firmicutes bacterium]|nr:hypothetical protein [Bacillota bacterium]